jgi:hypothetical protein
MIECGGVYGQNKEITWGKDKGTTKTQEVISGKTCGDDKY